MREEKKHAEVGKRVRNTRKDQSMAGVINFILTGVHAACMHCMQSACRAVKIELKPGLNLMRVPDAPQSALIIRMDMQSPLTALHASCMHCMQTCQDCECCLKSKSLSDMWLPDPYPMQGFLWKGGSIYCGFHWQLNPQCLPRLSLEMTCFIVTVIVEKQWHFESPASWIPHWKVQFSDSLGRPLLRTLWADPPPPP